MTRSKNSKNAVPGSSELASLAACSASHAARLRMIASYRDSLVGKCRLTVPVPTPARRAISCTDTDRPSAANVSKATWSIRSRLRRASARNGRTASSSMSHLSRIT